MTRKQFQAQRIQAGQYQYRTYLIEEVSRDAGEAKPRWNISVPGEGAVDAAGSLSQAKAMIDYWFEQSYAGAQKLPG